MLLKINHKNFFGFKSFLFFCLMSKHEERIVGESLKLFMENGIRSVTMDDIAAQCGISKRTLYEHFSDKEALLTCCIKSIQSKKNQDHAAIIKASEHVIEVMMGKIKLVLKEGADCVPAFYREIAKYYPSVHAIKQRHFKEFVSKEVKDLLAKGIKQGLFRTELNVDIVSALLMGQMQFVIQELSAHSKYSFAEIFKTMMFSFARGISTPKGLALIADFEKKTRAIL